MFAYRYTDINKIPLCILPFQFPTYNSQLPVSDLQLFILFFRIVQKNVQLEEMAKKQEDLELKIINLTNVSLKSNIFFCENYQYRI